MITVGLIVWQKKNKIFRSVWLNKYLLLLPKITEIILSFDDDDDDDDDERICFNVA